MIKPFAQEDFQKCCDLYIHTFNSPPWHDEWTEETAKTFMKELIAHHRFIGYTLWDDDALVGVLFAHLQYYYRGYEVFVDELFIAPSHQGKGLGSALMAEIEKFADENNCVSIALLTGVDKPAYDFYTKRNYKHLDYMAFMYRYLR